MTDSIVETTDLNKSGGPRFSIIPGTFSCDARAGIWHFRVLTLLGRHIDRAGWCHRSQIKMAKELGCTRQTVNRAIGDLCEWGYVEKTDQGTTRRSICFYRVVLDPKVQPEVCNSDLTYGGDCNSPVTGDCNSSDDTSVTPPVTGGVTAAVTPITSPVKRPQVNDQEARERASDEAARAPAQVKRPTPSITVKSGEAAFSAWIEHLRTTGRSGLADDARDVGLLTVPKRWPSGDDSPLDVPKPPRNGLSDVSRRMAGETGK